jgi:hypothetical protein
MADIQKYERTFSIRHASHAASVEKCRERRRTAGWLPQSVAIIITDHTGPARFVEAVAIALRLMMLKVPMVLMLNAECREANSNARGAFVGMLGFVADKDFAEMTLRRHSIGHFSLIIN